MDMDYMFIRWVTWILIHGFVYLKVLYCRDNSKLSSCGGDRQVFYWDVATGRVIRKFRGHDSEVCEKLIFVPIIV